MKSDRQQNVEAARKMPKKKRDKANARWAIVHGELMDRVAALPARRMPKVFEVHHAMEIARAAFIAELVAGSDLSACRDAAIAAFPKF